MGPSCPLVSAHALSGFRDKSPIPAARGFHLLDGPDIWAILRTLEGVDDKLLEHPAFARLPDELENGEIPESVAWNRDADVYVATDRRIIHLQRAVWSKSIMSVASYLYSDLRSFRADTGFASLGCNMVLVKGGVKTLPMKPQTRQRFATVVRSHMPTHQVSETDPRPAASSQPPKTPSPSTQSNPRKGAWIGCGTIVAVLVVVVVLVATMCSFGDDSPTPTPTATNICESPRAKAYLAILSTEFLNLSEFSTTLGQQFGDMGRNPALILDENWRLLTVLGLAGLSASADMMEGQTPPASLRDLHTVVRQMAGELNTAVELYAESIDEIDASKMETATSHLDNANTYVVEVQRVIMRLCG